MNIKTSTGRKIRYGGTSLVLTALIVAIVIIVNAAMTLLTQKFMWYGDLTPEPHFTISDECISLIKDGNSNADTDSPIEMVKKFRADNKAYNEAHNLKPGDGGYRDDEAYNKANNLNPGDEGYREGGDEYNKAHNLKEGDDGYRDEDVVINILFPVEPDALESDSTTLYVKNNAEELRAKFDGYITTEYVNAISNPKRFEKYLSSNVEKISLESVIIECGSEFRINTLRSFYVFNNGEPYAYNGEKAFASSILAVTRAEMPLACYITNHGESFPLSAEVDENGNQLIPFLDVLANAGYRSQPIDLSKEEIPEECRLLITFNPKQDFISGKTGISLDKQGELKKLEQYLEKEKAFMVFLDQSTGELENLEEFLAEWGLAVNRKDGNPIMIADDENSVPNNRDAIYAEYGVNDIMDGWAENLSATVVFENAMAIKYAEGKGYKVTTQPLATNEKVLFEIAASPSYNRAVFTMFNSSAVAKGYVAGSHVSDVDASEKDRLKLMGVAVQTDYKQEKYSLIESSSYVVLCGSTQFASDEYIYSNSYGNEDLLLSVFQMCGREPVPVGLDYKEFTNYKIETISSKTATTITVAFTVIPVAIALCAGVFVLVRRKNR